MRLPRVFLWLIFSAGVAHAASPLYDCPAGGFALTPPVGWEIKQEAGEPFPTLSGPAEDLRSPYVVIKAVHDQKDLFDLGDATIKEMLKDSHYALDLRDAFETADQQFGLKFVLSVSVSMPPVALLATAANTPVTYRQAYYFVAGPPGTIYGILATVPEAGWKKYEPLLDEMMKSYHLRPVVAAPSAKAAPAPAKLN
jgi:hypothetical protein